MAWEVITPSARSTSTADYALRFARHKSNNGNVIAITLSEAFLKMAKWKIGDRFQIMIDLDRKLIGMERVNSMAGLKIQSNGPKNGTKSGSARLSKSQVLAIGDLLVANEPRFIEFNQVRFEDAVVVIPLPMNC